MSSKLIHAKISKKTKKHSSVYSAIEFYAYIYN